MEEYMIWDNTSPGISFNVESGRINIFKTTLVAMGYPEYFRFRFSPEDMFFGIEPCGIDDEGAKRKLTYRIPGEKYAPDSGLVVFDLRKAFEIHEGRMKEAERITGA